MKPVNELSTTNVEIVQQNSPHKKNNQNQIATVRPIHYLGSKLRIIDSIIEAIDRIDPSKGAVCDLFAGSGTVSKSLSLKRSVTSVDIQEYSRVLCSGLLNPVSGRPTDAHEFVLHCEKSKFYSMLTWCAETLIDYETECMNKALAGNPGPLCELVENSSLIIFEKKQSMNLSSGLIGALQTTLKRLEKSHLLSGPEALTTRYFGGTYFSFLQAVQLDTILYEISLLNERSKDTYRAAALSTASDLVNTVGKQFAQPLKTTNPDGTPKNNIVNRIRTDRKQKCFSLYEGWLQFYLSGTPAIHRHFVYRMDYACALDKMLQMPDLDLKVVYADPPYTRYHYSRYYHVLETICLRDNPRITKVYRNGKKVFSRGIYREKRHQSPFSLQTKALGAFEILFEKTRKLDSSLVLSYSPYDQTKNSTPRVVPMKTLEQMASKYFSRVEVVSVGSFSHSKLNHSDNNFAMNRDAERLIICEL